MNQTTEKPWAGLYPPEIPSSLSYDEKPLPAFLEKAATAYPDKKALSFKGASLTYAELFSQANALAWQLINLGVNKGDRVAIMLPNSPQSVISYYGVLLAGATVVQTNPLYVERELSHQLVDAEAKVIICLDMLYPKVTAVLEDSCLEHVIVTGIKDYLPFPKNIVYPFIQKRQYKMKVNVTYGEKVHPFTALVKTKNQDKPKVDIDPAADLALLQYTGGTTGPAKGVMLTHKNLVANTQQCLSWMYKLNEGQEKTLAVLPFFHVYGMTVSMNLSIMHASEMVILPRFDAKEVLQTIMKEKISILPGAPTIYIGLINHPDINKYNLSSIKACISGSASLPVEVQQEFEALTGGKLVEGYGLTEASPVTHCNLLWGERQESSIGIPWPDTEAKIIKENDQGEAEMGEVGELAVRGPQVMKGYWKRPEETNASFHEDWLLTGDMAYRDKHGFFYIVDRKKEMIIAGGFNIYPREIEEVLYEHDDVQEAVVIGVPDPYRGETVKAFVVPKEGETVNEQELNSFCRERLASYKVPRAYEFRKELPKTMVGKVLKRVLAEEEKAKLTEQKQEEKTS
ncbi:long-chain-fatty-acid--CoA ligase [Salsuginibacillus kocurii]|uniref:long-chain-fatty-acid--CoA ligase n=1 Tax=Salsuginibacillus kocurii TaxID=427078 RepID=UPI00036E8DB9|nr:long-chain-fatty-acid--CoA ligase [Salsuginibacillus kocurii]